MYTETIAGKSFKYREKKTKKKNDAVTIFTTHLLWRSNMKYLIMIIDEYYLLNNLILNVIVNYLPNSTDIDLTICSNASDSFIRIVTC